METFSALLAICAGNSPIPGEQRPVTRSFYGFFICTRINGGVNKGEADDLRRHRVHYDAIVMDVEGIELTREVLIHIFMIKCKSFLVQHTSDADDFLVF